MGLKKVIEVLGSSEESWEDAAQQIVTEAAQTLRGIKSLYIQEMSARVEGDEIVEYRIDGKVTFELEEEDDD